MKLEEKRRFLQEGEEPTLPFVVELANGQRGEAITPLHLMDLIIHEYFSDCDDIHTLYLLGVKTLRDIAASTLSMNGIRATVYDGAGPFYDNAISRFKDEVGEEEELEFSNPEDPVILDGWDAWTVVASLTKAGYIKVYEKMPVWSDKKKCQGCTGCIFKHEKEEGGAYCSVWESSGVFEIWDRACPFVTNGELYSEYHKVQPEEIVDGSYKGGWVPIPDRKNEYIGFRKSVIKRGE